MALISLQNIHIAFGGPLILDDLSLQIEKNQRVCLLGRNGRGKSTLMKIIQGEVAPDGGEVQKSPGLKVSYFMQEVPKDLDGTVFDIIARGVGQGGTLLADFIKMERQIASGHSDASIEKLHELQTELEAHQGWQALEEIKKITSRMNLASDWEYATLSGGQKRRVLLAAALASQPDLLLLDEPTNHLDIATITWLEEYLLRLNSTLLFVTHDRMLLKRLATRIIELDRGQLADWSCDYETFLQRKQALLDAQEKEWETFDKKLAQEEIWIRKGIKARRTRNEGRVRALKKMREDRKQRRHQEGNAAIKLGEARKSGKLVIEAKDIAYNYDSQPLIQNFNAIIARGDKIGILGPNGCGKTTLVNILLGKLQPDTGEVRLGSNLSITYYDQLREQIDEDKSVWENVSPNGDVVTVGGADRHIISYLQDFLFTPDRAKTPAGILSGGERNRLLLARLFTKSANLLVMDEPTNDLDAETLELLEEQLVNFKGTLILISHDRAFLNNVVTSMLVFAGDGEVRDFVGGYDDWVSQTKKAVAATPKDDVKIDKKQQYREAQKAQRKKKLSYKETQELKSLPAQIEALETEQHELQMKMADHTFYEDKIAVDTARVRLAEIEAILVKSYERWEYLESLES